MFFSALLQFTGVFIVFYLLASKRMTTQQIEYAESNMRLSLIFFFCIILLFVWLFVLPRSTSQIARYESEKLQREQLEAYTKEIEKQYMEIRKFRHDYLNIFITLQHYVEEEDLNSLFHYLKNEILPTRERFLLDDCQLAFLANITISEIKAIVASKLIQAKNADIETILEIPQRIEAVFINKLALCRILGILLDNAIEESAKNDTSTIKIAFLCYANLQVIIVENSINGNLPSIRKMFQEGFSTKGNGRGLGLSILKEIIEENGKATLETRIKDNSLVQKIVLRNEE